VFDDLYLCEVKIDGRGGNRLSFLYFIYYGTEIAASVSKHHIGSLTEYLFREVYLTSLTNYSRQFSVFLKFRLDTSLISISHPPSRGRAL
jgi:hypothetical protein